MSNYVTINDLKTKSVKELEGKWFSQMGECCGFDARIENGIVMCSRSICGHGYDFEDEKISFEVLRDAILEFVENIVEFSPEGKAKDFFDIQVKGIDLNIRVCLDLLDEEDDFVLR